MGSPFSPGKSRTTKSQNKLKKEKRNLSYADLHSEVMNDVNSMPSTSSGLPQKQQVSSKEIENEELVKYMSKLPSYLEKGENVKARPLNIGVLDWGTLENWQYYHSKTPSRSNRYSASSSITDGASNHNTRRRHSCSPSRMGRRPTLQSYLNISPLEGHFEFVQPSVGNDSKFRDTKAITSFSVDEKHNIPREYQFFKTKYSETKVKECKKKNVDVRSIHKTRKSRYVENDGAPLSSKGKPKVYDVVASAKESEKLRSPYDNSIHNDSDKNVVLLLPNDGAGTMQSETSRPFVLPRINGQNSTKSPQTSSVGFHFEEIYRAKNCSSTSQALLLPCEIHGANGNESQMGQQISVNPISVKSLKESDVKTGSVSATKVRNASPTRRFSIDLNMKGRSSNRKEPATVPQLNCSDITAKSGALRTDASACSNNSASDKPNVVSKDRISPLKRLLDPLLKPKAANAPFSEQSQNDSASSNRPSTSFDTRRKSSSVNPAKVKLDFSSLRTCNTEKQGSATLQAYVQIAVKNDLPLFTFAVDNSSDVLAATVRNFSSRKDDPTWIYTFFTIHEMKKKNGGWLSHGSKGKDYIPNVVAQMKVSDLPFSNSDEHHFANISSTREYVLFAVDLRPFDQQTSDVQPDDELAAIVVNFSRSTSTDFKELSEDVRGSCNSRNLQELLSTTVILPGGVHGQPSKGEPSPLIERWLSGGLCDCGGWDLGCRVKVLANKNRKPTGKFELFSESKEKVLETMPSFTLSPLKNGIFSAEFDSSISLLQAFSICIAVLDSKKSSELQNTRTLLEEKLPEETTLHINCKRTSELQQVQADVPQRYASHPPHSPVGRV